MRSRRHNRGFTFLEMALTLFSVGFVLAAVPGFLNQAQQAMTTAANSVPTEATELALDGFILANRRLPCPARTAQGGAEDCSIARGFVPFRTLGLARPAANSAGQPLGYALLDDSANNNRLGIASAKYEPEYLDSSATYWNPPAILRSQQVNGLDFCAKLRHAATLAPQPGQTGVKNVRGGNGVNVAWVLVDPGAGAADGSNSATASGWFESPSRPKDNSYDDQVRVGTLPQVFAAVHCPILLANVSAAAREADYANDHWRVRKFLYDFRSYELDVRRQKKVQADNFLMLAYFDISLTVSMSALDLGVGLASAAGAGAIAVSAINAAIGISMSVDNLLSAQQSVADARAEVTEGVARQSDAATAVASADTFRGARRTALLTLDQRGWFQ
jgi:hypothetical protein